MSGKSLGGKGAVTNMKIVPVMGNYCRAAAMATVMNYYGYHLSEAMCFGIGEAFDFSGSDVRFGRKRIYKCYAGNNENDIFRFSVQMKVKTEVYRAGNRKETKEAICRFIDKDKPVIARVSIDKYMRLLPGTPRENLEMMKAVFQIINGAAGNHVTVISNTGKEKVLVHEPNIAMPVMLPWKNLLDAMNPQNAVVRHPSNTIYVMTPSVPAEKMETEDRMCPVIWSAISHNMKNYLFTQGTWSGIGQIGIYGKGLLQAGNPDEFKKNAVLFRFFCDIVTGGGFYRRLYARFLREANEMYLHDKGIEEVSKKYFGLSRQWSRLSKAAADYGQKPEDGDFARLEKEWKEIELLEKELAEKLYRRSIGG